MVQQWQFVEIAVLLLVAALTRVQCQTSRRQCVERIVYCEKGKVLDDCNIDHYHQYVKMDSNQILINSQNRVSTKTLKGDRQGLTGNCYIEVILGKDDNILFIRFGSRRVFTGQAENSNWKKFSALDKAYEDKPDGMQMLLELDRSQFCLRRHKELAVKQWSLLYDSLFYNRLLYDSPYSIKFYNVLARFTDRASILNGPLERYTMEEFEFIEFITNIYSFLDMQAVSRIPNFPINLKQFLDDNASQRLTVWVYKCPAAMSINGRPCNSEANVDIYLRQWINSSVLKDFSAEAQFRREIMYMDIPLIILMTIFSLYIALQLTLLSWFGLANASAEAGN